MTEQQRCENCRFFSWDKEEDVDFCRRLPRVPLQGFTLIGTEFKTWVEYRHPETFKGQWCGEWQAKEAG